MRAHEAARDVPVVPVTADVERARELGIPEGAELWASAPAAVTGFDELTVEEFGVLQPLSDPEESPWPSTIIALNGQPWRSLQVWQRIVRHAELWLELRWHPESGVRVSMHGLEGVSTKKAAVTLSRGLELLRHIDPRRHTEPATRVRMERRAASAARARELKRQGRTRRQIAHELGLIDGRRKDPLRQVSKLLKLKPGDGV